MKNAQKLRISQENAEAQLDLDKNQTNFEKQLSIVGEECYVSRGCQGW